ncbi:MAG: hypothetical protein IKW66_06815, partial [Clostridia bacterium]|nr:hypothetical protein [Clostridia bacterium]
GVFRYRIVRDEDAKTDVSKMAASLHTGLEQVLDRKDVEITTDYDAPVEWEILIGLTNRPESEQVHATLTEKQFAIRVMNEGKTIVIVGHDDDYTIKAVDYFLRTYVGYDYISGVGEMKENISLDLDLNEIKLPAATQEYADEPTLVQTKYSTEDVVIADIIAGRDNYGIDPTGVADSTAGIQAALNDCEKRGGGTVFLPAGNYRITKQIRIPSYTVLRGDWQHPDFGTEYGTVILADVKSSDEMTNGTFLLGASGGAYGLTVYYPNQSIDNVKPYPFTFYFNPNMSGKGWHAPTVKNCTVINAYRGVGATPMDESGHEQMTIENFYGTCLDIGVAIASSSDVGTCTNITISPKYWGEFAAARQLSAVDTAKVAAYTKANAVGMRLADVEWTEYIHITITDCKTGIWIVHSDRIGFAGSFYDTVVTNCGTAVNAELLDKRWGAHFSNSYLSGDNYGVINSSEGIIKVAGTTIIGGLSGEILVDEDLLTNYNIDTGVTYQKPNAFLYVADLDKTGKTNVAAQLQAILNEAGKTGGVVYLPGGNYLIDDPITVPSGVELRGTSPVATREESGYGIGTRIFTHYGVGNGEADTALITLGAYAGVNGIRFIYTSNHSGIRETSYAIRGTGRGVYVVNSCLILAGRGIDFADCDFHLIKKVTSFCFINDIRVGGEGGNVTGFLHNATVCDRIAFTPESGELGGDMLNPAYSNRNEVGRDYDTAIIVVDGYNQRIWNAFAYGVAHFIYAENSKGTLAVNIGTDNIGSKTAQMVVSGGDFTAINVLRYNGHSYDVLDGGYITLYSRLAIGDKTEGTVKNETAN